MTKTEHQVVADESEISFNDIIDFFVTSWRVLAIGAFFGLIIAFGGTLLLGKYEAEAVLINKPGTDKPGTDKPGTDRSDMYRSGIDYATWKSLRRNLPILADRIAGPDKSGGNFFNALGSEKWWQKNVAPTFALTKEDSKEIFGLSKELQEVESTKIKDFVVKAAGADKESALKNLSVAASFFRSGSAYLALKDVIENYQIGLLNSESQIAKEISSSIIELTYLNKRITELESLRKKFPENNTIINGQTAEGQNSSFKYLPVGLQLIAVHKDINDLKEKLSRLNNRKSQLEAINSFLSQAKPVMDRNFDGLSTAVELMRIETGLRKSVPDSELNKISMLDDIRHELTVIHTRFTIGLEQSTFIKVSKPGYLKPAAIGLLAGFFIALLGSLCAVALNRYRRQAGCRAA